MSERTCSVEGCESAVLARGWCHIHYSRWRRHGDPLQVYEVGSKKKACSVDGCDRLATRRGYCTRHYAVWRTHGDAAYQKPGVTERFLARLEPGDPDECWEWPGTRDGEGYGVISSGVRRGQTLLVHRVSYEYFRGPIDPATPHVCHTCDNPPCCNPDHLWLGTHADNMRDMGDKGRARNGRPLPPKTHCPQGHPLDEANTYVNQGKRFCRECGRQRNREFYRRQRGLD